MSQAGPCGHRDGPAQAVGHDRGDGRRRDGPRRRPVRHRPAPATRAMLRLTPGSGRTGSGRSRAAAGSAGTSRLGCWPMASRSSTCHRSCPLGRGSSPPARAARPTPPTRTPSPWSAPGWPGFDRWSTTSSSPCCGFWPTGAASLGEDHTRMVSQLHHLLLELIPGGAKKDLSAAQAKALLATVRPRDAAGKARRRVAAELIADLERIYARKKAADKELTRAGRRHRHHPDGPARHRTLRRGPAAGRGRRHHPVPRPQAHFASWNGTAPIDASSGDQVATGSPAPGTGRSTGCCTSWRPSSCATRPRAAPTSTARKQPGKTSDGSHAMPETAPVRHRLPAPWSTTPSRAR